MKYAQLSSTAQNRAFNDYIAHLPNDSWDDEIKKEITADIEEVGGSDVEIVFDQERGEAIFSCSIEVEIFIEQRGLKSQFPLLRYIIDNADSNDPYCNVWMDEEDFINGVDTFEYHTDIDISKYTDSEIEELETEMSSWVDDMNREIYQRMEQEYKKISTMSYFRNYNYEQEFDYNADGSLA